MVGVLVGILLSLAATVHAATYEVRPGGLNAAISQMQPGDTLLLRGGTYQEQIGWPGAYPPSGTSWGNATTIAGYPGETAILAPQSGGGVVTFSTGANLSYIVFDNLTLDAQALDPFTSVAMFVGGTNHHIRVSNSDIKNGGCVNFETGRGSSFIEVLNTKNHNARSCYAFYIEGSDSLFDGNEVYDNPGYSYHVFSSGQTTVSNNVIRNNLIHDNGHCNGQGPCHYQGNVILANGSNNQAYNNTITGSFMGVQIGSSCVGCVVRNNMITGNANDGISLDAGATNTQITDNILANNGGVPIRDYGSVGTVATGNGVDAAGAGGGSPPPTPGPSVQVPLPVLPNVPPVHLARSP